MNSHKKTYQPIKCSRNFQSTGNLSEKTSPKKINDPSYQYNEFQQEFHHGISIVARY